MKILVTGAAGSLGARLADSLLSAESPLSVTNLVLADLHMPPLRFDTRVRVVGLDLTDPTTAEELIDDDCAIIFHLAAIVSGDAETDFDLGLKVNLDATRALLEVARRRVPTVKFVFVSTVGVFGGDLPPIVDDRTATMPQTSYGVAKAAAELLVSEYSRRGFVDGRVARLPTVSVRRGTANAAVTSFASSVVREPLNGLNAVCPVPPEQRLWLTSPRVVLRNLLHLATIPSAALGSWRVVNLPGFSVSVQEMVAALRTVAGDAVADRVSFERDDDIARMVASFPSEFENSHALNLGFHVDTNFIDVIRAYISDDLKYYKRTAK